MVELTGYHGTIKENAKKIIKENHYKLSTKNDEWLGDGIYFFKDIFWANYWARMVSKNWHGQPAVLKSLISCKNEEYFDLDSVDNKKKIENSLKDFANTESSVGAPKFKDEKETRRFYCNFYAELNNILVYSCNFPGVGFDDLGFPKAQVQYCVRDNSAIKSREIME
nr:MAG TPA: hypothetical protein [Caudoviricetes sp.]